MSDHAPRAFGLVGVLFTLLGFSSPEVLAQCRQDQQAPLVYMGLAREGATVPNRGMQLSLARFPEAFVICGPSGSEGKLKEISLIQLRKESKEITDDVPVRIPFEKLRTRGYVSYRDHSVYGRILTSQLVCPGCNIEDENHKMKLRLLHEFSLWGASHSDYREIGVSFQFNHGAKAYRASHYGNEAHLVVHYPGKWGVNHVVIAECKDSDIRNCLENKNSTMVVTEVIHLEDVNTTRIQTSH